MKLVDLNSLDREKTYYHFTPRYNYESICEKGLLAKIGSNANGIERNKTRAEFDITYDVEV